MGNPLTKWSHKVFLWFLVFVFGVYCLFLGREKLASMPVGGGAAAPAAAAEAAPAAAEEKKGFYISHFFLLYNKFPWWFAISPSFDWEGCVDNNNCYWRFCFVLRKNPIVICLCVVCDLFFVVLQKPRRRRRKSSPNPKTMIWDSVFSIKKFDKTYFLTYLIM